MTWYAGLLGSLLLSLALGVMPGTTAGSTPGAHEGHSGDAGHGGHAAMPAGTFSAQSLYHLESVWSTESGQRLRLGDLRGKIQVVVMAYTSCEYACPLLIDLMKRLEAALPAELLAQVGFIMVSFDPERDTPDILKAYSAKRQLDLQRWTLLHGDAADVLELAVLLGVKYKRESRGDFAHSNLLTVLNKTGEIVHRHMGLAAQLEETLAAIRQAARVQ